MYGTFKCEVGEAVVAMLEPIQQRYKEIRQDDYMGIGDSGILSVGQNLEETVHDMVGQLIDEDSAIVSIYYGSDSTEESAAEIAEVIQPQFPESDIDTLTTIINRYKSQDTWKEDPCISEEGFTLMQEIMKQGGELSKPVPFDKLVDSTFAEKVITK